MSARSPLQTSWYAKWFLAVLACGLLLGGGTRDGFLSDAVLQAICVPLLIVTLWILSRNLDQRDVRFALFMSLAVAAVPLLQLVPMPPWLWSHLPHRGPQVATFQLIDVAVPWLPVSVSPRATTLAALSLIPPITIFLGTLILGRQQRRVASLVVIGIGLVGLLVGLAQFAQGRNSPLYFFALTNLGEPVGFFANRNHQATFLFSVLLLILAWLVDVLLISPRRYRAPRTAILVVGVAVIIAIIAAQALSRSRAGLALSVIALGAAYILVPGRPPSEPWETTGWNWRWWGGAALVVLLIAVQLPLYAILERISFDRIEDARPVFVRVTLEAARAYLPIGAGMGTFPTVYAMFERPEVALPDIYVNRAHNDFAELALEAGVVGYLLLCIVAVKFLRQAWQLWRSSEVELRGIDLALPKAAFVALGLIAVHSCVDYPLRTAAIESLCALFFGLLLPSIYSSAEESDEIALKETAQATTPRPRAREHAFFQRGPDPKQAPAPSAGTGKFERWGKDVVWPKEWSTPRKDDTSRG